MRVPFPHPPEEPLERRAWWGGFLAGLWLQAAVILALVAATWR